MPERFQYIHYILFHIPLFKHFPPFMCTSGYPAKVIVERIGKNYNA